MIDFEAIKANGHIEKIDEVCVEGTWLRCDDRSFVLLESKTGIVACFQSGNAAVFADPEQIRAVSIGTPLRTWPS